VTSSVRRPPEASLPGPVRIVSERLATPFDFPLVELPLAAFVPGCPWREWGRLRSLHGREVRSRRSGSGCRLADQEDGRGPRALVEVPDGGPVERVSMAKPAGADG
jgi:hypothetical protein